jgi:acetoin utilization deacetylase AcuC-like enzyme
VDLYYSDHFAPRLPAGHRFPMAKYRLLREAVAADPRLDSGRLHAAEPASDEQLLRVHTRDWVERVAGGELTTGELRRLGFPWSPELVERSRRSVGGTLGACRSALADGCGANLAGGTHHAFADRGEGFCVFNDVAVAIRELQADGSVRRAWVIDCDVHQGDGTAAIFRDDPSVFTMSIHGRRNYPLRKEASDLDVELEDGTGDAEYLEALGRALAALGEPSEVDLVVYLAGADPFVGDRLGRLSLTVEGLAARDRLVLSSCRRQGLPVALVMAGGYAEQVEKIVSIHHQTLCIAGDG